MAFIQTDTFQIRSYECDARGQLSVPALMNLMQESANRNALDYGIGIVDLARQGYGWMLSRFQLRMHQYPRYNQSIQVITYPTFVEKYFIYRDFRILAGDGTLLADASSTWLVFDTERRVMVPLPGFIRTLTPPAGINPLSKLLLKPDFPMLSFESAGEKVVEVGWFDIDQNQHVNNVAYVQWLLEAMHHEILHGGEVAEIDLVYRTESHWGDSLRVRAAVETGHTFLHRVEHDASGKEALLARSRWRESLNRTAGVA